MSLALTLSVSTALLGACSRQNELNGTSINDPNSFRNLIAASPPGSEVTLTIKRGGSEQQVRATLGEFTLQAERPRGSP
jgi:S1-C subfamily serine protease